MVRYPREMRAHLASLEDMRIRTSDAVMESPSEGAPPPEARYMRGATYSDYDGLGWSNDELTSRPI